MWYSRYGNNMHFSRQQLKSVELPKNDEWDTEFARACNGSLPFDRCASHLGSEGWGDDARFYNDLQVRVYDLLDDLRDVEKRLVKNTSSVVKSDRVQVENNGAWRRVLIVYNRQHFDYNATAYIDFRFRRVRGRVILFVFMYTSGLENDGAIRSILNSLEGGGGKGDIGGKRGT